MDREVEKVRWDLINEYISFPVVKKVYGVVIDPETFVVDEEKTRKLREKRKNQKIV